MEKRTELTSNLVSVIIPVRNGGSFISEAIGSCLSQETQFAYNIIVVNDGSTDDTVRKVKDISRIDPRVNLLHSQGRGVGQALQVGLEHSDAVYILRLDADDRMLPGRIQRQVDSLMSDKSLVLCGTQIRLFGNTDASFAPNFYPLANSDICKFMQQGNAFADPSVAFKRLSALEVGGFPLRLDGAEQYHLWLRLSKVGKLMNLSEELTEYRIHPKQFTQSKISKVVTRTSLVQILWFFGFTQLKLIVKMGSFRSYSGGVGRRLIPHNLTKYLLFSLVAWVRS